MSRIKRINYNEIISMLYGFKNLMSNGFIELDKGINFKMNGVLPIENISFDNLKYANDRYLKNTPHNLIQMNAARLGFLSESFDLVFCIQNGISAFKEKPMKLIEESIRVTKPGGRVLFSSYSPKIWDVRLEWFQEQSDHGLLGEIDYNLTGDGVIICKDGFRATTFNAFDFEQLTTGFNKEVKIFEVDNSSIFFEIIV